MLSPTQSATELPSRITGLGSQEPDGLTAPAADSTVTPSRSTQRRLALRVSCELPESCRAKKRKVGYSLPTQTGAETAWPPAPMASECVPVSAKVSLPSTTPAPERVQPAVPDSNVPPGART